jgi:hypothetical protein
MDGPGGYGSQRTGSTVAHAGYRVDLDEMDQALVRLYDWVRRMQDANAKARYETGLSLEALGTGFEEAYQFYAAHALAKTHIEDISAHLSQLAEEITRKLRRTHDRYQDSEYQA